MKFIEVKRIIRGYIVNMKIYNEKIGLIKRGKLTLKICILVFKNAPLLISITIILRIMQSFIPFLNLILLKNLINIVQYSLDKGSILLNPIISTFTLIAVIRILSTIISYFDNQTHSILALKLSNYFITQIMRKASLLSYEALENPNMQDMIFFLRRETPKGPHRIIKTLLSMIGHITTMVSMGIIVFNWSLLWGTIIIASVLPPALVGVYFGRLKYALSKKLAPLRRNNFYHSFILTTISHLRELIIFSATDKIITKYSNIFNEIFTQEFRLGLISTISNLIASLFAVLIILWSQFRAIHTTIAQSLTVGWLTAIFGSISSLWSSTQSFIQSLPSLYEDLLFVNKLVTFLELEEEGLQNEPSSGLYYFNNKPFLLQLENIHYSYDDRVVINGLDLNISSGDHIGIVGKNGEGKTTLCDILQGLRHPEEGQILLNGFNREYLSREEINKFCSTMYQDFTRFELPYYENVSISRFDDSPELVGDFIDRLDKHSLVAGNRTMLTQRLGNWFKDSIQLSGGQWQKVALYRTLYREASLYILDEPTASLDEKAITDVVEIIRSIDRMAAVIVVSHDYTFLQRCCDKIYNLNLGRLAEIDIKVGIRL